jgi:uncharacterized protein (TIGR03086 family)
VTTLAEPVGLLERAISYALTAVQAVAPTHLSRATPCPRWDLRTLLTHATESLTDLHQAIDAGYLDYRGSRAHRDTAADPVTTFRERASQLVGAWTTRCGQDHAITIVDRPLTASIVASTGAVEIAVHGWDIARTCGNRQSIPPALATELLAISQVLVTDATRHPMFDPPVPVSPQASPSDRLVAFLGRTP